MVGLVLVFRSLSLLFSYDKFEEYGIYDLYFMVFKSVSKMNKKEKCDIHPLDTIPNTGKPKFLLNL